MRTTTRIYKKSSNVPVTNFVKPSLLATSHSFPVQTDLDQHPVRTMDEITTQRQKQESFGHDHLNNISFGSSHNASYPGFIQPKLTIGEPNDKYEQEADQVASQVVNNINNPSQTAQKQENPEEEELQTKPLSQSIQRQETSEEEEMVQTKPLSQSIQRQETPEEEELQTKPLSQSIQRQETPEEEEMAQTKPLSQSIQRQEVPEKEEELQAKSTGNAPLQANEQLEQSIQQARGSGQGLDDNIRQPMESAFGADFSGVRVHTDSTSDTMNRAIQARAFTTGQDVFFRQGEYNPSHRSGQELLAHELTHVVQQTGGVRQKSVQKKVTNLNLQPKNSLVVRKE